MSLKGLKVMKYVFRYKFGLSVAKLYSMHRWERDRLSGYRNEIWNGDSTAATFLWYVPSDVNPPPD